MMDNKFNCQRLKEARILRGLSQLELAARLGVTKQCVSQYENGVVSPRGSAIFDMAQILNMPIQYFGKESIENVNTPVFFRSGKTSKKKMKDTFSTYIKWTQEIYLYICDYINLPEFNIMKKTQDEYSYEEINIIAQELRTYWNLGNGPISNLMLLLENNGFIISKTPLDGELVDACSQYYASKTSELNRSMIFLTSSKSAVRSRRDLAHELGHQVLHSWRGTEDYEKRSNTFEIEADIFASCFLMPPSAMEREAFSVTSLESLLQLKKRWGTSAQSILYHMHDLGLISEEKFERLKRNIYIHRWRKCEPFDNTISQEEPEIIKDAIEMLFAAGVKNALEFQNDIAFPTNELAQICGLPSELFSTPEAKRAKLYFARET